jgi:hypothetical protein
LLVALLTTGAASAQPLSIRPATLAWSKTVAPDAPADWLQTQWADGSIVMPYVSGGGPGVAARINQALFLQLLAVAAPVEPGARFTLPPHTKPLAPNRVQFSVRRNDRKIVAIETLGEGCGVSCSVWQVEYHFDVRDGRELYVDDLFTPRGRMIAALRMSEERTRQYRKEVGRLLGRLRSLRHSKQRTDRKPLEESLAVNRWCLERTREDREQMAERYAAEEDGLFDDELQLADSQRVSLRQEAWCRGVRPRDSAITLGSIVLAIPLGELRGLLTPYGKALLLGEGSAPPPRSPFGQILVGQIGDSRVTVRLDRPYRDGSFAGIYFHDKQRRPIELSGRSKGSQVERVEELVDGEQATIRLTEKDGEQATLRLTERDGGLVGTRTGKDKQLPVVLHR